MEIRKFFNDLTTHLNKAISHDPAYGTAVREFIKEDLEGEAHNQLWNEEDPDEMVLLKLMPRVPARQVNHQFTRLDSYGNTHSEAGFAANALPSVQDFEGERETVVMKPYGHVAQVQGLAALEQNIKALGEQTIPEIDRAAVRRSLLYKINVDLIESDTRLTQNPNKFEGIIQQIDELTRATGATEPDPNVIIDMRGENLSLSGTKGIRTKSREVQDLYGKMRWLIMSTVQQEKLEEELDGKQRYIVQMANNPEKKILGAALDGAVTSSGVTMFAPDVAMSSRVLTGRPNTKAIASAPAQYAEGVSGGGTFSVAAASAPSGVTSQWDAIDRLDQSGTGSTNLEIAYGIVAINEIGASVVGYHSSVNIASGQVAAITIRPRGGEMSFKIYRGIRNQGDTSWVWDAEFVMEVPNDTSSSNTTPFTVYDANDTIPGTTYALGLNIHGEHSTSWAEGKVPTTLQNVARKATNGMSLAQLTNMFVFDLAKVNWLAVYELFCWVLAPQVEKPFQHRVWKNLGRKQIVTGVLPA